MYRSLYLRARPDYISSFIRYLFLFFIPVICLLTGCVQLPQKELLSRPSVPVSPSDKKEIALALQKKYGPYDMSRPWEQELACGWAFAGQGDFYRAITSFQKSSILLDLMSGISIDEEAKNSVRIEAATGIISSYILSDKYTQAIEAWESLREHLSLTHHKEEAKWLLILLTQAYSATGATDELAQSLASMLPKHDPDREKLLCYLAMRESSLSPLHCDAKEDASEPSSPPGLTQKTQHIFTKWDKERKSPNTAMLMNLIMPGSGYAYLGQWPTATTSLAVNALFIGATVEFFKAGQPLAALLALGFEVGWYGGGAAGARLSAEEYNHQRWLELAKKFIREEGIYPEAILWKSLNNPNDSATSIP